MSSLAPVQLFQWAYILVVFVAAILVGRRYLKDRQRPSLLLAAGLGGLAISQLVSVSYSILFFAILGQSDLENISGSVLLSNVILIVTIVLNTMGIVLLMAGALIVHRE